MAPRIYPTWEQINDSPQPPTEGEYALLEYLDKYLPKDDNWQTDDELSNYKGWLIFFQPYLNGTRPDIVIFNPYVGGLIYEVKDWNLDHYKWKNVNDKNKLFVKHSGGENEIKSPLTQVIHYKEKLIGQLIPNIGEKAVKNKKAYGLVKVGVYFHNEKTARCEDFFSEKVKSYKSFPVFGYDTLTDPQNIYKIAPDSIRNNSTYWNREWNNEVLFWLRPPYHSIEQGTVLNLNAEQKKIAEPKPGHHRARGVAGSGKTQALAYRAAKLASMDKDILIISFNITLWHFIKDMIARAPFSFSWERITFNHFHGFCRDILNELGVKWPESPDEKKFSDPIEYQKELETFFRITVPNKVISAIKNKSIKKYDAILIDEGQDYYLEWYKMLHEYFLRSRDEVFVVVDRRQNIYERTLDWIDRRNPNKEELSKFETDIINLTTTFRIPLRASKLANSFSKRFSLDQDIRLAKTTRNSQMSKLFHEDHIIWRNIEKSSWLTWIFKAFEKLKENNQSPSDIVILLPNHKIGYECVDFFEKKGIKVNHVFERNSEDKYPHHKKSFWRGDGRLKMSTIHSFKGWELLNIILYIPETAPESNRKLDAIIYTAITRTQLNLIIFNAHGRYWEFGEKYPKKWAEQSIFQ
jgi:hypothetical protein